MAQHILIVEDENAMALSLAVTLKKAGYSIETIDDPQAALDIIDKHKVDLILLDIFLNNGNGIALLHELKTHDDMAAIPVIVCTNSFSKTQDEALQRYGVEAVLDKATLTPAILRENIASAFA